MDLIENIGTLQNEAMAAIEQASDLKTLEEIHNQYLGRKGAIKNLLRSMGKVAPEERPAIGKKVNESFETVQSAFGEKQTLLQAQSNAQKVRQEAIDVTLPGRRQPQGAFHPLTQIVNEIIEIFSGLGFEVATGPEIETDYYNFESLNIPPDHPARDMQDTFYLSENMVLRTHTSPVQIRYMEKNPPPTRIISPGRVYRNETADATHLPMFTQVEGLMVDEGIHFGHLKAVLETFVHRMFSPDTQVRFRPSFFPFTEPSAEVDILFEKSESSEKYRDGQARVGEGWLEIMGCGMVDPEVFGFVNYDSEKYTGFAFGMGCERIAMLKYGIEDIRMLYDNDVRILKQFA